MSERSMLKLFEVKRAWTVQRRASHCRDSFIAGQEVYFLGRSSDRPALRTQVRGAGETDRWTSTRSVRPSSRASVGAQKHRRGCW
jgi:hypothetical protein